MAKPYSGNKLIWYGMSRLEKMLVAEEREYSILLVMSELSTVRCDRVLGL